MDKFRVFVYMLMRDASLKQRIPCIMRISIFGAFSAGKKCALYTGKYGKYTFSLLSSFPSLDICSFKSLPKAELGNWCQQRLIGAQRKFVAQQGGFHGDPVSGNQPCQQPTTSNRVLTLFWLPKRVRRAVNLLSKQCRKNCYDSKARVDGK